MIKIGKWTEFAMKRWNELTVDECSLLCEAMRVRNYAQAPYTQVHEGVAIRSGNMKIHFGCNVERDTRTLSTGAVRNAVDTMIASEGSATIASLAFARAPKEVLVRPDHFSGAHVYRMQDVVMPDHDARQIIWEHCGGDETVPVLSMVSSGEIAVIEIGELMAMHFCNHDAVIHCA